MIENHLMEISFRINDPFMMKNSFLQRVMPHEKTDFKNDSTEANNKNV